MSQTAGVTQRKRPATTKSTKPRRKPPHPAASSSSVVDAIGGDFQASVGSAEVGAGGGGSEDFAQALQFVFGCGAQKAVVPEALATEFTTRCGHSTVALSENPAGRILPFSITALDISATQLRSHFAAGRSARYLLPEPVLDYIFYHQLYLPSHS